MKHRRGRRGPFAARVGKSSLSRIGLVGVLFFLLKGLAWLLVPAALAYIRTRR